MNDERLVNEGDARGFRGDRYPRELVIDPEFKALIPPLSSDEYALLEKSILAEGCRDPLTVWKRTLLDGHNRYTICHQHGVHFDTVERDFDNREEALVWIIQNQLGRRNLTPFARSELALKLKDVIAAKARDNMSAGGKGDKILSPLDDKGFPNLGNLPADIDDKGFQNSGNLHTDKALAQIADVSHDTIHKVEAVVEHAPDGIKAAARRGDLSVDRAYRLTRALSDAGERTRDYVVRQDIEDVETVKWLADGERKRSEWFDELITSDHIQPGDEGEAVSIHAGLLELQKAARLREKAQKLLAYESKLAAKPTPVAGVPTPVLYVGRAEDLAMLANDSIDLIITSPPYNLGGSVWNMGGEGRTKRLAGIGYEDDLEEIAYQDWQVACLVEWYRVARPGASLFYNHKTRNRNGALIHPMDWLRDKRNLWTLRQEIIWDRKSTHNHNPTLFYPEDERIYWLTKGVPTLQEGNSIGMSTVWREFGPEPNRSWHPAPFPDSLPEMCIKAVGRPNITVLDPFSGRCTTVRVALRYGYEAIGVDISEEYLSKAKEEFGWTNDFGL